MKKKMNFTIDEEIAKVFRKTCEENSINMSAWIEKQMYKLTKEKKVK